MKNLNALRLPELSASEACSTEGGVKIGGCIPPRNPFADTGFIPFGPPWPVIIRK